jgi:hypothetical protein
LAAFAFVRLISALPLTPGGVGVVELVYAAVMTIGLDNITSAQVVAAILVFRAVTYLLPIPLGVVSYVVWRVNKTWKMTEEERATMSGDAYEFEAGIASSSTEQKTAMKSRGLRRRLELRRSLLIVLESPG